MEGNFLIRNKIRLALAAESADTTELEGAIIFMQGFRQITFFGTIDVANPGNYLSVEQGQEDDLSDAVDIAGSKVVALINGDVVSHGMYRTHDRYVRAKITRTASTATGDLYYILSDPGKMPVDNNESGEIVSVFAVSPDEGTA